MQVDNLITEVFEVRTNPALAIKLLAINDGDFDPGTWIYGVYERGHPEKLIYTNKFEGNESDVKLSFKSELSEYIRRYYPKTPLDLAIFLRFFFPLSEHYSIKNLWNHAFKRQELVDSVLESTKGFLLWHGQLETLISMFLREEDAILRIRIGLNERSPDIEAEAKKMIIGNISLFDIFNERTINITDYPDLHSAWNLWQALRREF